MQNDNAGPTLTDAEGMGGVIAQDGFDFQLWDGLSRLPGWLQNPAFEALIFEGLEDLEARFFAPTAPQRRLLERYQAKSGGLQPQDVVAVFERFFEFEQAHPQVARVQTLVTPLLPPTIRWVGRDAARVRRARPFYAPFARIVTTSDDAFKNELVTKYGQRLGTFIAENVEVDERSWPTKGAAAAGFGEAFGRAFPGIDVLQSRMTSAFNGICELARQNIGCSLSRKQLVDCIEANLHTALFSSGAFPVFIRSDRNGSNEGALELDASGFSGQGRTFPPPEEWQRDLVQPVEATAQWLSSYAIRRVSIRGSYRLTTGFVLGSSLRAAHGFDLDIPTRECAWPTDDHADANQRTDWVISLPEILASDDLVVSVGVLRQPANDLRMKGTAPNAILDAFLAQPVTSAKAAQHGVAQVKAAVSIAASRLKPKKIRLYYAGPAAFAVALGHRWNALPQTCLHEFIANRGYVATATIA
jgi:hypothetical protein